MSLPDRLAKWGLANQPVAYEKLATAIVSVLVGFSVVNWTETQVALVYTLVGSVLGLLVWSQVTPNAKVAEKVESAVNTRELEINSYLNEMAASEGVIEPPVEVSEAPAKVAAKVAAQPAKKAVKKAVKKAAKASKRTSA